MDNSNITIQTDNLLLKSITLDYKKDIFREFTPEVTEFMYPKSAEKIEETIEFIKSAMKKNVEGEDLQVVILSKESEEFLGCGGLHHIDRKDPEFGVWIKKSAHGNAYGREAMMALKKWADENLRYEYLLYPADKKNMASKKVAEFLGGKFFREHDKKNMSGKTLNLVEYRIYPEKK